MRHKTLQDESATKKKKRPTHHKQQKRYRFTKHKNKNNKTCENGDPIKLELSYLQNTQQRKAWPQRGRGSTLTFIHVCHRPRIPFGHVLIERMCFIKHCKREGAAKKRKDQPTTNNKKDTVSKTHKNKKKQNV